MFKKSEKKEKYQGDPDSITEPKGALKWIGEIIFILLLIPIATVSYKAFDVFRGNEKVPEALRDYATTDFMGIQPYIVVSNSMKGDAKDDFEAGDLVICTLTTADEIEVGDIVSYTIGDPLDRYIVIHRVVEENEDGTFTFKGDANNTTDLATVSSDQIQAKYCFKIAKLGYVVQFIGEHRVQLVLGIVALYCIVVVVDTLKDKDDDDDDNENGDDGEPVNPEDPTDESEESADEVESPELEETEGDEVVSEPTEEPVEELPAEDLTEDIPAVETVLNEEPEPVKEEDIPELREDFIGPVQPEDKEKEIEELKAMIIGKPALDLDNPTIRVDAPVEEVKEEPKSEEDELKDTVEEQITDEKEVAEIKYVSPKWEYEHSKPERKNLFYEEDHTVEDLPEDLQ